MNDWESVKEVQALSGRLDFMHIYAQRKLTFISKLSRLNNDVMKACFDNIFVDLMKAWGYIVSLISLLVRLLMILEMLFLITFIVLLLWSKCICIFFTLLYCKILYCIVSSYCSLFLYCIFVCFLPMWRINVFIIQSLAYLPLGHCAMHPFAKS